MLYTACNKARGWGHCPGHGRAGAPPSSFISVCCPSSNTNIKYTQSVNSLTIFVSNNIYFGKTRVATNGRCPSRGLQQVLWWKPRSEAKAPPCWSLRKNIAQRLRGEMLVIPNGSITAGELPSLRAAGERAPPGAVIHSCSPVALLWAGGSDAG